MIKTITLIGFLLLGVAFNANAQDIDRVDQLEKEVQEIKLQLSKLESLQSTPRKVNETVTSGEGWKSLVNWRKLTTDMDYSAVQKILGEPNHIHGGQFANWQYQNDGEVHFMQGKVNSWTEPRQ